MRCVRRAWWVVLRTCCRRRVLLEVATHLLLFVPQASGPKISTPLQAAQAQVRASRDTLRTRTMSQPVDARAPHNVFVCPAPMPKQAGGGGAGGVAGAASTVREPPPGMSTQDVASLADKAGTLPAGEVLTRRKLGVLHFLAGVRRAGALLRGLRLRVAATPCPS